MPRPRRHRIGFLFLTLVMVVTVWLNVRPRPAAALIPTVTTVTTDIPRTIFQAIDKVRQKLATAFKASGDIAFKNSIQIFESKLLQQVQTSLSSVGPGQKPLFLTNPKKFFTNVADASAGDFIDDFARNVSGDNSTGPGEPISGARGKFLISRLLRAQANSVVGGVTTQCKTDCGNNFSVGSIGTNLVTNMTAKDFADESPNMYRNEHERRVLQLTFDIAGQNGIQSKVDTADPANPTTVVCPDIGALAGPLLQNPYQIQLGSTSVSLSPNDCLQAYTQLINNERSLAQAETNQCLQTCQVRGSAATNAINGLTATDIFSAVQNASPSQAPAALANALSNDKSDLGQFLTAAGALTATVQQDVLGEQTNLNPNILPVTARVSGEVITPSSAASTLFGVPTTSDSGQFTYTGTSVADILKGIASFINSPVGKALATYFNSKCGLNPSICKGPSNARSSIGQLVFGNGNPTGIAGAQLLYASSGKADINTGGPGQNEIAITDQLSSGGLIDAGFRQAIEEVLTVQEALDKHFLDAKKTFGFDKNGIEPATGYPFRALQYLRKYRIIPVGWELAAKYSQLFDHRDLSLGYLTSRYQTCGQDATHKVCSRGQKSDQACQLDSDCGTDSNGATISCGSSPYCGLVDPNWVLKAPQTYCRRQGAGEEIVAKEFVCDTNNVDATTGSVIPAGVTCDATSDICTDTGAPNCVQSSANPHPDAGRWVIERNADTCADSQSCIAENEDGSCQAYGYCVQERQQFKFDGTQCSSENSTCTSYTDTSGQQVAYLASTLDSRNCTADNAGCTQYCAQSSYDPATSTCTGTDTINLTAKVQQCEQSQVGCTQYLQTTNNTNLLPNAGFETVDQGVDSGNSANVAGWAKGGGLQAYPVSPDDPTVTAGNTVALKMVGGATDGLTQIVHTGHELYERTFTLSVHAKAAAACSATLQLAPEPNVASGPKVPASGNPNVNVTTDWQTVQATLTVPPQGSLTLPTFDVKAGIALGTCAGQSLIIDSAQLEEAFSASNFRDYGTVNAVYLNGNRAVCSAADVGCQNYTPLAGGEKVVGQVLNSNRCSADAVGCASYHLEPISSVPQRDFPGGKSVNIVAPKGQICSAADVGCEEYTNLDEVAKGGEGKEYYKSVKQCVKPDQTDGTNPISATYYTWVGDANLGYVLRSYDLVQSNLGPAPCTSMKIGQVGTQPECNDTAGPNGTVAAAQVNCKVAADLVTNPECAQYYDAGLTAYYRLRASTVTITEDCHPYRNTIDQSDVALKNNVYYLSTSENVSCSAAAAGCRAYTGNASGTTRQVLNDTFEANGTVNWLGGSASNASVNVNGHSMLITTNGPAVSAVTQPKISANQFYAGRTYLVTFTAAAVSSTLPTITAAIGRYAVPTFDVDVPLPGQAKGSWNTKITPSGPEWKTFTLGPVTLTQDFTADQFGFTVKDGSAYIDNVVVTEVNDHVYYIGNSVPQCSIADVGCSAYRDQNGTVNYLTSFNRLCSEQVAGCEALIDTKNSSNPFTQTTATTPSVVTPADSVTTVVNNPSNYCPASAKGCSVVGLPVYTADQKTSGYLSKYLILDPDRYSQDLCSDNELQCQVYTGSDGTASYFKDPSQRVCDYRTGGDGNGQWYITGTTQLCPTVTPPLAGRPIGASCSPVCASGSRLGQACSTNTDCPAMNPGQGCTGDPSTVGMVKNGASAKIGQCSSNTDCLGGNACVYYAGSCPADQNGCTEYRDPTDPVSCQSTCPLSLSLGGTPDLVDASCARTQCKDGGRVGQNCASDLDCQDASGSHSCVGGDGTTPAVGLPGCRSYFYIRQSLETNASLCNGKVDTALGCRPFNDTSNSTLNYRGQ